MDIPNTLQMVELFEQHPAGLLLDEMRVKLNRKDNKAVQNTIQLLKKQGYEIHNNGGIYSLGNKPILNELKDGPTRITLELLRKNPDGMAPEKIAKECRCKKENISSRIFYLKQKGFNIINKNGKYFYVGESEPTVSKVVPTSAGVIPTNKSTNKSSITTLIPKHLHSTFLKLSDSDKIDCIDMLRKSLYYHKSALSLLESNECIESFVSSIEGAF